MSRTLILLRHGQSEWNASNLFTGWHDVDLTPQGEAEARAAGPTLAKEGLLPDVVHTSLLTRAIRTANLSLAAMDRAWVPVRRTWRLNERHYGALTGLDKKETAEKYGAEQVHIWRRSFDTPPPPVELDSQYYPRADARYAALPTDILPRTECLADVIDRMLPWWYDGIVPDLQAGKTVLVAAHGNSLRALVKHLDGVSDEAITELNIPTGIPVLYELNDDMEAQPVADFSKRYVGDVEAALAAARAVAAQTGA